MAEAAKFIIKVYNEMPLRQFTEEFVAEKSVLESGSISAASAAGAASLFERAANAALQENPENERVAYIARNAGILRSYMVHLVDDDVKCRAPLRRARKEGDAQKEEACLHPACEINGEIVNMMNQMLELEAELLPNVPADAKHYLEESAELALAAVKVSIRWILNLVKGSSDETFRFVSKRENEITLQSVTENYEKILAGAVKLEE